MTWRRLHMVLFIITLVVAFIRLSMGNVIGALFAFVLAALFASIAFDFPLLQRMKTVAALIRRYLLGGSGKER